MPLYSYNCEAGHTSERLAPRDTDLVYCACGAPARRNSVYRVAHNRFSSPVDFHMTASMRAAHEEALGLKADALAQKAEHVGNGWRAEA